MNKNLKQANSESYQYINRAVKDGTYFEESLEWYIYKYVSPITERCYSFLFAVISLLCFVISIIGINSIGDISSQIPFVTYVPDSLSKISNIKHIGSKKESPQQAVTRYLIYDYITTREEFFPDKMDDKNYQRILKKIKSSSSKAVLNEFKNYMNATNPYSPFVRYKDGKSRSIHITGISFAKDDPTSGKATVMFNAIESSIGQADKSSSWEVSLNYKVPDMEMIAKTQAPLRFLVKYYKAKQLDGINKN